MTYELAMIFSQAVGAAVHRHAVRDDGIRSVQATQPRGLVFRQHGNGSASALVTSGWRWVERCCLARRVDALGRRCHLVCALALVSPLGNRNTRSKTPETHATATSARGSNAGPPKGAKTPAKPAARGQAICLRHLLHNQDTAQFPDRCKAPPPCSRNHNVQLHVGKLAPQEKADALASLVNMKGGIFPAAATKYIVAHL